MTGLEVWRDPAGYPANQVLERFDRFGIVILKEYFPAHLQGDLRAIADHHLEASRSRGGVLKVGQFPEADFLLGDILAVRQLAPFQHLFFGKELLQALRTVLRSEQLVYWGDSSIQYGAAARGFHKDNVGRYDATHNDWVGDYDLIRCGFYFQDHSYHSGGLKVRLGSHRIVDYRVGPMSDVASTFGDLAFWSMRLTHSGNNRRLRAFPNVPVHPRVEAKLPGWMMLPEQCRRISAFCAFARPGPQTDCYIDNMNRRDADYRGYFQRALKADEAGPLLGRYGVQFVRPNAYYGELNAAHA
jgi:hypothetical protein